MKKYFNEEKKEKYLLSEYLKMKKEDVKSTLCDEDIRLRRTKYLIEILGDVTLDKDMYKLYINSFQSFGGRYSVRTREDTLTDIYNIYKNYEYLSIYAIEKIWFIYIRDLFNEYNIMDVLEKIIKIFGKTEEAFELFIQYIEKKSDELQQKYIEDTLNLEELKDKYSENFISHLKDLILSQHYAYEEIKKYLPSSELIKKDEEHILELSRKTRIYFGCCNPVSYTLFDSMLENKTLDGYNEILKYYINNDREELATFTKQEFLESIKKSSSLKK